MSESTNRAFMYGESVFTTIRRGKDGELFDWDQHVERLVKSVSFVYGPFADEREWITHFKERVQSIIPLEKEEAIIRLTIFQAEGRGLLVKGPIESNKLKIQVNVVAYDPNEYFKKRIHLRSCPGPQRPSWWPGFLKCGNYLETILSQKRFMKPGDDDVLFLGPNQNVLETSIANIFIVKNNKLSTPPVGPNVLEGTMRKKIISNAKDFFDEFTESEISLNQIIQSDGVFATNAIRGPFLIGKIDDHELSYKTNFLDKFESLRKRTFG